MKLTKSRKTENSAQLGTLIWKLRTKNRQIINTDNRFYPFKLQFIASEKVKGLLYTLELARVLKKLSRDKSKGFKLHLFKETDRIIGLSCEEVIRLAAKILRT